MNEAAIANPQLLNQDPYGAGWFARIHPDDWENEAKLLLSGAAAIEAYRKVLEQEGIQCS